MSATETIQRLEIAMHDAVLVHHVVTKGSSKEQIWLVEQPRGLIRLKEYREARRE